MQFIIHAYDGTDEGALARRMSVRAEHLANIKKVQEYGSVVCGGGMTDEAGLPIGSFLVLDFASKELFDQYLESEPYVRAGVWQTIKVETCNVVMLQDEMVGK